MNSKYSYGHPEIHSHVGSGKFILGNFCSIAGGVNIFLGNNHRTDWVTTYPFGCINKDQIEKLLEIKWCIGMMKK